MTTVNLDNELLCTRDKIHDDKRNEHFFVTYSAASSLHPRCHVCPEVNRRRERVQVSVFTAHHKDKRKPTRMQRDRVAGEGKEMDAAQKRGIRGSPIRC